MERQRVGLFEKLGLSVLERPKPTLKPVPTPEDPQAVCAPVAGRVIALEDVSDPAFAQGMLGVGLGIEPAGDVAYSPVTGVVATEVRTRHALVIKAESGAEVLLHVGLDSVELRGAGFRQLVAVGETVRAGQPVLRFDRALLAQRGLDGTVMLTVTNPDDFSSVEVRAAGDKDDPAEVRAGDALIRCVS